eukprot:7389031-Prymnesium_polylepis.2
MPSSSDGSSSSLIQWVYSSNPTGGFILYTLGTAAMQLAEAHCASHNLPFLSTRAAAAGAMISLLRTRYSAERESPGPERVRRAVRSGPVADLHLASRHEGVESNAGKRRSMQPPQPKISYTPPNDYLTATYSSAPRQMVESSTRHTLQQRPIQGERHDTRLGRSWPPSVLVPNSWDVCVDVREDDAVPKCEAIDRVMRGAIRNDEALHNLDEWRPVDAVTRDGEADHPEVAVLVQRRREKPEQRALIDRVGLHRSKVDVRARLQIVPSDLDGREC